MRPAPRRATLGRMEPALTRLLDPLLVPRLALRALDDFHAMGNLARAVSDEERVDLARALDDLHSLAEATERLGAVERRLTDAEHTVAERTARLNQQLSEVLALGGSLHAGLRGMLVLTEVLEQLVERLEHLLGVPAAMRGATARLTGRH